MPKNFLTEETENEIIRLLQKNLENSSSVPDALTNFSQSIIESSVIPDNIKILLANSVDEYCSLINNRKYLAALRKTFNLIYDFIPEIVGKDVTFKMESRRKSVTSTIEKMLKFLKEGKSLDLLRDCMGIRVIFFGKENTKIQNSLYLAAEEIIKFMLDRGFKLCEADKISTETKLSNGINILIPKKSLVPSIYETCVKDYIKYPKPNGYQSLHIVFRARNGSCIEIQARTEQMHIHSEYGVAKHEIHKENRYGLALKSKVDFSKIHMPGFRYLENGTIYDDIGLQESLLVYYRTKSF